jgi:glycosyltransferase involved in cell wall biosynthesis
MTTHQPERRAGSAAMGQPVADAPSWAHASGWAQLSGARQTVSCVLPCENSARTLSKLLPILSDTLTECGYPWEVIVVDGGSTDGTDGLMQAWCELPGFRFLQLDGAASLAASFEAGILASRGDAVILLDPALLHSPELIPQMILQWESDARLVYAQRTGEPGHSMLRQWDDTLMRQQLSRPDFVLPPQCMELGLLDRRLVDGLLQAG